MKTFKDIKNVLICGGGGVSYYLAHQPEEQQVR